MRSRMHLYQSIAAAIMQLGQLARPAKAFLMDLGRTQNCKTYRACIAEFRDPRCNASLS